MDKEEMVGLIQGLVDFAEDNLEIVNKYFESQKFPATNEKELTYLYNSAEDIYKE